MTLPELVRETERTLASARRLTRYKGHFFNWYDSESLMAIEPPFVSTVDSGNLVCSLWTLKQGCLRMRTEPFLKAPLWQGVRDHARLIWELVEGVKGRTCRQRSGLPSASCGRSPKAWVRILIPGLRLCHVCNRKSHISRNSWRAGQNRNPRRSGGGPARSL